MKIIIVVVAALCCVVLIVGIHNIIHLRNVGGGELPEFNEYGIAFIVDEDIRTEDIEYDGRILKRNYKSYGKVIVNRLGFDVVSDLDFFYESGLDGVYCFRSSTGYTGLINEHGKIITEAKFDDISYTYIYGLMGVQADGLWGCVDGNTGEMLIKPQYSRLGDVSGTSDDCLTNSSEFEVIFNQYRDANK